MRTVDSDVLTALGQRALKSRDFIWLSDVSGDNTLGLWNDLGNVTVDYFDVTTGLTSTRDYIGVGGLLTIDSIPLTNDVTVRTVKVTVSQIDETIANLVRGYNVRGAPVEIHRGLFNPGTFQLVAAIEPRFVGFNDTMEILDPSEGQEGSITLNLVSHTRELTRTNTDVASDASQKLRSATDNFYQDVGVVGSWQIYWGQKKGNVVDNSSRLPGTYSRDPNANKV